MYVRVVKRELISHFDVGGDAYKRVREQHNNIKWARSDETRTPTTLPRCLWMLMIKPPPLLLLLTMVVVVVGVFQQQQQQQLPWMRSSLLTRKAATMVVTRTSH